MTTMGVYVRDLLLGQYYFDTLFPRMLVPVMCQVVANLEKLKLPTKHLGVTGETHRHGSDDTARRPPSVKAALSVSFGQRAPHRASTRDSSPVRRTLPLPPYERNGGEDARSPSRRSQSRDRDYRDRDWDRERDSRDRVRDRDYRDRDREWRHDYDDRSRSRRDYDRSSRGASYRRSKSRSRSRSRSRSQSRSRSLQAGSSRPHRDETNKVGASTSSNLAKLKDMYGDLSSSKGGDSSGGEKVLMRDNSGEEVIRLGGGT